MTREEFIKGLEADKKAREMTREEFIKGLEADKKARETRWTLGSNAESEYHRDKRVAQLKKEFGIK